MSLLVTLIVGGIIGWLAAQLMGRSEGMFGSIAIGVVGSVLGGLLASLFMNGNQSYMTFTWSGVVWSLIGSIVFVAILNAIQGSRHKTQGF